MTTVTVAGITADIDLIDEAHGHAAQALELFVAACRAMAASADPDADQDPPQEAVPDLAGLGDAIRVLMQRWIGMEQELRRDLWLRRTTLAADAAGGEYGDV